MSCVCYQVSNWQPAQPHGNDINSHQALVAEAICQGTYSLPLLADAATLQLRSPTDEPIHAGAATGY